MKKIVIGVLITVCVFIILLIGGILTFLFAIKDELVSSDLIPTIAEEIKQDQKYDTNFITGVASEDTNNYTSSQTTATTFQNVLVINSVSGTTNALKIDAQTNLPDGTTFGLAINSDEEIVKDQVYTTDIQLTAKDNKISKTIDLSKLNLKAGEYEMELYSIPASEQSNTVQAEIGTDGSKLVGDEVESITKDGKRVFYIDETFDFNISNSGNITPELQD